MESKRLNAAIAFRLNWTVRWQVKVRYFLSLILLSPLGRSFGQIQSNRLRRAKRPLKSGDELHLYYDPKVQAEVPPAPTMIADVGGYSVWRKPYGMRSQGSKWGDHCTIMRWAEQHLEPERTSFTVHRLDLAANGLILVAHSKKIAGALGSLFQAREIEKRYRAIVKGDFSVHSAPLRDPGRALAKGGHR